MSTFRDAARSIYDQESYDFDNTDSGRCGECEKKSEDCRCPDMTPVFIKIPCDECGKEFLTEDEGRDCTETVCCSCRTKDVETTAEITF